jgi:hypothetical protein
MFILCDLILYLILFYINFFWFVTHLTFHWTQQNTL